MYAKFLEDCSAHDFHSFQVGIMDYLVLHANRMQIPSYLLTELQDLKVQWEQAYEIGVLSDANRKEKTQVTYVRNLYKVRLKILLTSFLYNKSGFVQPDDLAAMGLRTRERAAYRSFEVPLTEVPQVTVQTFTGCVLEFKVTNNSGKYSKPPGITHLEIRYHIGDNPPEFSEDYRGLYLSSKCRFLLQLDAGMSMNKIYITTRWIARNGHFLPFSIPKVSFVL